MERDDLKVARVRRMAQRMGAIASNDEQRGFVDALDHVLALTRPTADLGEELVVEVADILARYPCRSSGALELDKLRRFEVAQHIVRAVLSRSGDD